MAKVVKEYVNVVNDCCKKKLPKLEDTMTRLTLELSRYNESVGITKQTLEQRKKTLTSFKHYSQKCEKLKGKQKKDREKGKPETIKQKQKVTRNNEKFEKSKKAFLTENESVIEILRNR